MRHARRAAIVACALLAVAACQKKDKAPSNAPPAPTPVSGGPAPAPTPVATPAADADYVEVLGSHSPAHDKDPVHVQFKTFKVVSASFADPKNLEGGSAELSIDLGSLDSGNGMRDGHLKSASYFDVEKFGTASVKIHDVKHAAADGKYDATADISVHGVTVSWPVEFEVIAMTGDSVTVRGERVLERSDFKVGVTPEEGDTTSEDVTFRLQLTLHK